MSYANNRDADQPAHPRSLISVFVVRCLDSIIPILSLAISILSSHVADFNARNKSLTAKLL